MAPIRYSLHYEDYSDHLMSRFGKLLQMQSLVDMTLMCSSHTLRVHKAVLAASSAYFQEVLQKQNCEPLVILKMRFSVLKCLVEFIYCGKTQCLEEHLDELVSAAQFLKIKGLSKVTKEGLGITNTTELPPFTPPVVINRPPKSLLQDNVELKKCLPGAVPPLPGPSDHPPSLRTAKDPTLRLPYDMEVGGVDPIMGMDYPPRFRARRGRPSARRLAGWESPPVLVRVAEKALLKREHDSRKAIHQLKNIQSRQMQASTEFMDRVTLTQAVNSICPSESPSDNYMSFDSDLLYLDQSMSSNILDPNTSTIKNTAFGNDICNSSYNHNAIPNKDTDSAGVGAAMSDYVNALKSAGLPTDLPILLESGDGSYINVNEKVLIDMVQSNEIQYEVIDQPNIIEKVADPNEIKSIDELSKSIERNELLIGSKNIQSSFFDKDSGEFLGHDEAISSLNAILPSNLDSFSIPDNFSAINNSMNVDGAMHADNNTDISSIVNDMFSKNVSDNAHTANYYDDCSKSKHVEQLCSVSSNLDTSFSMSFLDSKVPHFETDCMEQDYHRMNSDDLRRNVECYDFSLNLSQPSVFKDSDFDCIMASPKKEYNHDNNNVQPYNDTELIELRNALQDTPEFADSSKLMPNFDETFDKNVNKENDKKSVANETEYELKDFEKELDSLNKCEKENTIQPLQSSWNEILNSGNGVDENIENKVGIESNKSEVREDKTNTNEDVDSNNLQNIDSGVDSTTFNINHITTQESAGSKRSRDKDNPNDNKYSKRKVKSRKCE